MNAIPLISPILSFVPISLLLAAVFWKMGLNLRGIGAPRWLVYGSWICGALFLLVLLLLVSGVAA